MEILGIILAIILWVIMLIVGLILAIPPIFVFIVLPWVFGTALGEHIYEQEG